MVTTAIDKVRITRLQQQIDEIDNRGKATKTDAAKAVTLLLAFYPNQQVDESYQEILIDLLEGVDPKHLDKMVDVRNGIASSNEFIPSVAKIVEWLDKEEGFYRRARERLVIERDTLKSRDEWKQDPKEVREAKRAAWQQKKADFVKRGEEIEKARDKNPSSGMGDWKRPELSKEQWDQLR